MKEKNYDGHKICYLGKREKEMLGMTYVSEEK